MHASLKYQWTEGLLINASTELSCVHARGYKVLTSIRGRWRFSSVVVGGSVTWSLVTVTNRDDMSVTMTNRDDVSVTVTNRDDVPDDPQWNFAYS